MYVWRLFLITYFGFRSISIVHSSIKDLRDGTFVQEPYLNTIQNNKVDGMQKEVSLYWPKGIVNYYVEEKAYSNIVVEHIKKAMNLIQLNSCIKFNPLPSPPADNMTWIHITNPNKERECVHESRYAQNGEIILVLGYDCLTYKDVLHTILHGIGFKDEVTHPHRDKYIRVLWNNIQPGYRHLYRKQALEAAKHIAEYDPLSVMQFHDHAFSMNGRATIIPLESGLLMYPSETLSQLDRMRLQLYFGHECNKRKVTDLLNTCKTSLKEQGVALSKKLDVEDENSEMSESEGSDNTRIPGTKP